MSVTGRLLNLCPILLIYVNKICSIQFKTCTLNIKNTTGNRSVATIRLVVSISTYDGIPSGISINIYINCITLEIQYIL